MSARARQASLPQLKCSVRAAISASSSSKRVSPSKNAAARLSCRHGGADDISSLAHKAHKAEHPPARDDRAGQREPRWPRARPVCRRERHNAESVALRRAKQVFALRQQAFKRQGIGAESCTFEKLRAGDRVPYRDCARRYKKRLNIPRLPERAI